MSKNIAQEGSQTGRPLLDFYSERSGDDRGRTFREILAWSDRLLEDVHDYIQWLFPLPEPSSANPAAPVLDAVTIAEFRADGRLRARLRRAFLRMLEFYGLQMGPAGVERAGNFAVAGARWLKPGNHNHLRLSRILRSLRLLGLEQDALSLFACLRSIYEAEEDAGRHSITRRTFQYWSAAAAGDWDSSPEQRQPL